MRPVLFVLLMVSVVCLHGQEISRDTELPPLEADSAYTLGAGDRLRISVFNQDDLTGDYRVTFSPHENARGMTKLFDEELEEVECLICKTSTRAKLNRGGYEMCQMHARIYAKLMAILHEVQPND